MKKTHFIAIGGAIMHQLALVLKKQGYIVTGSDDEINDPAMTNLENAGILPTQNGWYPEKITSDIDEVILGMHARKDNPELIKAQELGLKIYSFPEYIYKLSTSKQRVVIAGSHGKTTITSMVMHVLKQSGVEFDYLVGAKLEGFEYSVKLTDAPIIIIEGDEYPASAIERKPKIFFYHPHITVINGIAWDHINVFPTFENYCDQFVTYMNNLDSDTLIFYNQEDDILNTLIRQNKSNVVARGYGTHPFHYNHEQTVLETPNGECDVQIFGKHNLINLSAAKEIVNALGVADDLFYKSIASFKGASRRLEKIADNDNLIVFRDFAHAPSKLKATVNSVKEALSNRKIIACFELHTFSSLNKDFLQEYDGCLNAADEAIVFFSHHALALKNLPNLNKESIKTFFNNNKVQIIDNKNELEKTIYQIVRNSQEKLCLLLMSSGTFEGIKWYF